MRFLALGSGVALLLSVAAASAQAPAETDAAFVAKASVGNEFEIQEAQLAQERATDSRLKDFAAKMIADHSDAEKKLQQAAGKAGDKTKTTLDKPHQAMLDNLKTFNGKDFDKVYTADQIQAHDETVDLLLDYHQNGKTRALKSWADDVLPIVKGHRAMIDAM